MPILQGLIFDLDGTLVDSAPDLRQALNMTLAEQGRPALTLEQVQAMVGDGMLVTLQRAFGATGAEISEEQSYRLFQNFVMHYRNQKADTEQIYPHVIAMLTHYKNLGIRLGLCTNKQQASTLRILDELNLASYFSFVAGGDALQVHKPHPGHVRGVVEGLGLTPAGCVMIGDSTNDIQAAKQAGVAVLMVTHGYGTDIDALGADGLIDNFEELGNALHQLGFTAPGSKPN